MHLTTGWRCIYNIQKIWNEQGDSNRKLTFSEVWKLASHLENKEQLWILIYFLFIIRTKAQATDHEKAALTIQSHRSETARGECWQESVYISPPVTGTAKWRWFSEDTYCCTAAKKHKQKNASNGARKQLGKRIRTG